MITVGECRTRLLVVFVCVGAILALDAAAQTAPDLKGDQRALLAALVTAVDEASIADATEAHAWQTHVMRASDGSHYVAFSVASTTARPVDPGPLLVYVRLATAPGAPDATAAARSAVREWLRGSRTDPRLLPKRGIAIGEMPAMGAGAIGMRGTGSVGSADLQMLGMERERARQRKEDQERQRKAELEGGGASGGGLLPFEDFDIVRPSAFGDGTPALQRALTAGPGAYDLYLGWVDASAKPARASIRVAKQSLRLPTAGTTQFGVSSIIVADRVGVRDTPYSALDQRGHPYAIGLTEITPASDSLFTRDERLSVAFQVVNPSADAGGKPDVSAALRILRLVGPREETAAALTPLRYDATTLPEDFDVRLGHPLLAAMSAPLATLPRGTYRLEITVTDHLSGIAARAAPADFRIVGTPQSLLAEAPALGRAFRRDTMFETATLDAAAAAIEPTAPSAALSRAIAAARERRFIDLIREDPVPPEEQGVRVALTAMALFSFGDASAGLLFDRAAQLGAPAGPLALFAGASHAESGRDVTAISSWQAALRAGIPREAVLPLLADAYLRRGQAADALEAAAAWRAAAPDADWWRAVAAASIAAGRPDEAVPLIRARLAGHPADQDAQWLLVHALYALVVKGQEGAAARFIEAGDAYVAGNGPHAALAREWLAGVRAQAAPQSIS